MLKSMAMKWAKALRSGKYDQGNGYLRNNNRYCCLGVLCDISKQSKWTKLKSANFYSYDKNAACLPTKLVEKYQMQSNFGYFGRDSLMNLNDTKKYNFNQLANIIEKHWDKL